MTRLHAGGKFDGKAYETSGGLHGVGVSVVNALSDDLIVEVARDQVLYRQSFPRGKPVSGVETIGKVQNRRGTTTRFHPDPQIFGGKAEFSAARLFRMTRVEGLSVRRRRDPLDLRREPRHRRRPGQGHASTSPAASRISSAIASRANRASSTRSSPAPSASPAATARSNGRSPGASATASSIPTATPCPTADGGTHEQGLRVALLRGLRNYAELIGQQARRLAHRRGRAGAVLAPCSRSSCASPNSSARPRTS